MRFAPPRQRLRTAHRILSVVAWIAFLATAWMALQVALRGGSPLLPSAVLYAGTVAYGLGAMMKLRERTLFGPGRAGGGGDGGPNSATPDPSPEPSPRSTSATAAVRWWLPRLLLVAVVAALPAALLLGGLQGR